jgi:hypothetical protein
MKHQKKLLLLVLLLIASQGFSQITTRWSASQTNAPFDWNSGKEFMRYSTQGIFVGIDNDPYNGTASGAVKLYKYATDCGELLWTYTYTNGANETKLVELTTDASNNIYLLIRVGAAGNCSTVLNKVNTSGSLVWSQTYTGGYPFGTNFNPSGLTIGSNGNIYICGQTQPAGAGQQRQFALIEYTAAGVKNGTVSHQFTYQSDDVNNMPEDVIVDGTNAYICGRINFIHPNWSTHVSGAMVKIPLAGGAHTEFYVNTYFITGILKNMTFDASGNVVCMGDYFIHKLNQTTLVPVWTNPYTVNQSLCEFRDFTMDGSGHVFGVYDATASDGSGNQFISTVKINGSTGVKFSSAWPVNYFTQSQNTSFTASISIDPSDNVYVGGATYENAPGSYRGYALMKYNNSTAAEIWKKQYYLSASADSRIFHIKATGDNSIFLTGTSGTDQVTMRMVSTSPAMQPCGGAGEGRMGIYHPDEAQIDLYPNPANTELFIDLKNVPSEEKVQIRIIGLLGNTVYEQTTSAGELNKINTSSFASGTYLIKISGNTFNRTEKIQVQK